MCVYKFNYEVDGNQLKGEVDYGEQVNLKIEEFSEQIRLETLEQFIDQITTWGNVKGIHQPPEGGGIKKILIKEKE